MKKISSKKAALPLLGIIVLLVAGFLVVMNWDKISTAAGLAALEVTPEEEEAAAITYRAVGTSATVYVNAYDRVATSETEVYPYYYITDDNGNKIVDNNGVNSTTTSVGQTLTFMGAGQTYYVPKMKFEVKNEAPTANIDAYTIITESSNTNGVIAFDDTMTALTATGANTSFVDYNVSQGASADDLITVRIKNVQANTRWDICMICTGAWGDLDDFAPTGSEWTKITMPEVIDDMAIVMPATHAGEGSTTVYFDACYKRSSTLTLDSWEKTDEPFLLEASATDPTGTGDYAWLQVIDCGYGKSTTGEILYDAYAHDSVENSSKIGLNEPIRSPSGKTTGIAINVK